MLLTVKVFLILVATVNTPFTDTATITTQVQIRDLGGVKVKVICLNLRTSGTFRPVSITPAVICWHPATGLRLQTHFFPSKK